MSKKQETTGAIDTIANVFDGIKRTSKTVIFESKETKDKLLVGTDEQKDVVIGNHTLTVEFDFTGLTIDECCNQLASTTSFMKLFQNNVIGNTDKRWDEATILDTVSKGTYHITCRSLLDDRTKKESDPLAAMVSKAKAMKAKGMSTDDIMAQLLAKLNS